MALYKVEVKVVSTTIGYTEASSPEIIKDFWENRNNSHELTWQHFNRDNQTEVVSIAEVSVGEDIS